jgi:large repetitive protein
MAPFAYGAATWVPVPGQWAPAPAALHAAGVGPGAPALTQGQLDATAAAALGRLGGHALPPVRFAVQGLGGDSLGLAFPAGRRVVMDDDAAGQGWFVDPTPGQDEEFRGAAGGPLSAAPGGPADGREDLLTAVLHELGHLAGRPDGSSGLMAGVLAPGVRETQALDQVFAQAAW